MVASTRFSRPGAPAVAPPRMGAHAGRFVHPRQARDESGSRRRPRPTAGVLIRRLSFQLTGMPPRPEEIDAFVRDQRPDAYERLVDRYLASPHYGVRWARWWLDLARYGESNGFEFDEFRPAAWRYRDWVVDAFNATVPYDEFARLQLAGDVLRPSDAEAIAATGLPRRRGL